MNEGDEEMERLSGEEENKEKNSSASSRGDYEQITYNAIIEKTLYEDKKNPNKCQCCCGCPFQVILIIMFVLTII